MKNYRWDGTATAVSSISHGGDTLGTVTYLRREAFLTPQGRLDIPVVSGNAVRGVLRDVAAKVTWEDLGCPKLPLPVAHALWAGGALVKVKGEPLSGQRLATLRRLVPHVGVFGAAGGGRIINGALAVGKLVPACTQTAHLLPEEVRDAGPLPDLHDLIQIEHYSRVPNADRLPDVLATPDLGDLDPVEDFDDGRMRYGTETFVAGTRFHAWFALNGATAAEHDFFTTVLNTYLAAPIVGGKIGRGHGRLAFHLTETRPDGDPGSDHAWNHRTEPDTDVLTALGWLD